MSKTGLILAAHGSTRDPDVNRSIVELADRCRHLLGIDEVVACFHQGVPGYHEVIDRLDASDVVVVPVMASEGFYCRDVLPCELAKNTRFAEVRLTITRPIGVHAALAAGLAKRVEKLAARFRLNAASVTLALVGHGTRRNKSSRDSLLGLARELSEIRKDGTDTGSDPLTDADPWPITDVCCAFIDDEPPVEGLASRARGAQLLVVPFLIGQGPHLLEDIPALLGAELKPDQGLPAEGIAGNKRVVIDLPVGSWPEIPELIVDVVKQALRSSQVIRPTKEILRLGTRASKMALAQAERVAGQLRRAGHNVELVELSTSGDRDRTVPICDLPSDAPFADDIDEALLEGRIDLAVHSFKDLPIEPVPGLRLSAVLKRDDAREVLVSRGPSLTELPPGATVGTSSHRREAQILALRPDLVPVPVRGPVDERLKYVDRREIDAVVLAAAGLERLAEWRRVTDVFSFDRMLPAPAQGALVVQVREDDQRAHCASNLLDDAAARLATFAELFLLRCLEGDRSVVLAAYGEVNGLLRLRSRILSPGGRLLAEADTWGDRYQRVAEDAWRFLQSQLLVGRRTNDER